jgi:FkbM family methyltransferase
VRVEDVGAFEARNAEARRVWDLERRLAHVVRASAPVVLDVGAHVGQSNRLFRRLFPAAAIWSFEPEPDAFAALAAAVDPSLPGGVERLALADRDGTATFHRNPIGHTSSLLARSAVSRDSIDLARARAAGAPAEVPSERIEVPVRRLDAWCAERGVDAVDLLKIDVQGAEVAVLEGAAGVLPGTVTVAVEISFFDLYERSSSFLEVEALLRPHGLDLYALAEVSDNPMNGRTDWVTAVYTRADFRDVPPPA